MRRKILIPSLPLSLLCACADDSRYLLTTAAPDNLVPGLWHRGKAKRTTPDTPPQRPAPRSSPYGSTVRSGLVIAPGSFGPSTNGTWP